MFGWLKRFVSDIRGETNILVALIVSIVLIFVGLEIVAAIAPLLGNITYAPEGIGATVFGIAQWLVPVLAIIGLIIFGIRHLIGSGH